MVNNFFLNDFSAWKNLNPSFSLYDYIYQKMTPDRSSTDIYFAFLEFFWPTFITYKNHIFLKENFTESKLNDLETQNEKMIEFWMNLLIIDPYFDDDENRDEKAEALSKALVEIWQTKLKKDFPHIEFIVEYVCDKEMGDYGLTFYQKKQ